MHARVEERSEAYLSLRDQAFLVDSMHSMRMHAILPGVVSNVSRYGLFVQIAGEIVGLVGLPELVGPPANQAQLGTNSASSTSNTPMTVILPYSALAGYEIAQRVSVRVISIRNVGDRTLVGLSMHLSRLNPALDSVAQLTAMHPACPSPLWGRVLLVEPRRATLSLEVEHPFELPHSNVSLIGPTGAHTVVPVDAESPVDAALGASQNATCRAHARTRRASRRGEDEDESSFESFPSLSRENGEDE